MEFANCVATWFYKIIVDVEKDVEHALRHMLAINILIGPVEQGPLTNLWFHVLLKVFRGFLKQTLFYIVVDALWCLRFNFLFILL